jgi:hypothetical protein
MVCFDGIVLSHVDPVLYKDKLKTKKKQHLPVFYKYPDVFQRKADVGGLYMRCIELCFDAWALCRG